MNDLFRFWLIRPASPVAARDVNSLTASFTRPEMTHDEALGAARAFVASGALTTSAESLTYAGLALQVATTLRGKPVPAAQVSALVSDATGDTMEKLVVNAAFVADETQLADTLVAMKLLSDSSGGDAPGLALVARGYDAIRLAASGRDPIALRVLSVADFVNRQKGRSAPPDVAPASPPLGPTSPLPTTVLADIEDALAVLGTVPAADFEGGTPETGAVGRVPASDARLSSASGAGPSTSGLAIRANRPWMMTQAAIAALPAKVTDTIARLGYDLATQPLSVVLNLLEAKRLEQMTLVGLTSNSGPVLVNTFGDASTMISASGYVGPPSGTVPSGHGSIRPVGIGDLLVVKQHILRYEGGDLAHIENVLRSEHLSRETRRLERTETTVLQETETTKEETRDTQTTDRFSLQRETTDTIKTDSSLKAGLSVDAKYGPSVDVKANSEFATSTSSDSSTKQASDFSKDVVDRSTSKLTERLLERRTVTTITEFEEKYSHGFDNTAGSGNISGCYQWVDKVLQAQVYNYGKRLLFDVTLPEPGTNYILSQLASDTTQTLEKPVPFTAKANEINEGNYTTLAKLYDATGLEPPPERVRTVVKAFDGVFSQDGHESSKSDTLAIDDGYRAKYVSFVKDAVVTQPNQQWRVFIGSTWFDALTGDQYRDMAGEVGSVGFAYDAHNINVMSASIEILCERTDRAMAVWQLKMHAAITTAYLAKEQAYEQQLAEARAAAGTVIAGRNPEFNQRLVANELRRQCLTLVTGQQFDAFGALELSSEGYAQPNLDRTAEQMPYVRFFEQAFEWEHLVYFFYPYFWGWKAGWKNRMLLDDTDPDFADFLRAGAARVVFPVRPGFEAAVVHYLDTPNGEIWNGGPPPDISSSMYLPIVKEIQDATDAPEGETPVGDPWEVRLPTTLVRLRPHDDLPTWEKVGEVWQPTN